jgi:hypothetical protein
MTYHPGLGRIVLFGGDSGAALLNDTWEYDGTTWRQVTPGRTPWARSAAMAAYDENHLQLLLFGGWGSVGDHVLNDLWEYRHDYPAGAVCSGDAQCTTGYCVDGVCCDGPCGAGADDCLACAVATGATRDGECAVAKKGTVCRGTSGDCDTAETCDGASALCPDDALKPAGAVCRPTAGACDIPETCTGYMAGCPTDGKREAGASCDDADPATRHDMCDANGICRGTAYTCTPGPCDESSTPDGDGCAVRPRRAGVACDSGNPCTTNDACDGSGRCVPGTYVCTDGGTADAADGGGDAGKKDAGTADAGSTDAGPAADGGAIQSDTGGSTGGAARDDGAAPEYATDATGCTCTTVSL